MLEIILPANTASGVANILHAVLDCVYSDRMHKLRLAPSPAEARDIRADISAQVTEEVYTLLLQEVPRVALSEVPAMQLAEYKTQFYGYTVFVCTAPQYNEGAKATVGVRMRYEK